MSLFFVSLKTRHLEYWLLVKKIGQKNFLKKINEWMKKNNNKQILNGCTFCLFTMRQKDQSFDKVLLGQNN